MGIRIHKVLGWGLTDVETDVETADFEIVDPRFNENSVVNGDYEEREKYTTEGYLEFLESRKSELSYLESFLLERRETNFQYCFVHQAEYGLPNVFCVYPVDSPDWHRYDDAIDYHQEERMTKDEPNYVKLLDTPIYPYLRHWDSRDGRICDYHSFMFFGRLVSSVKETLAIRLGFKNSIECQEYLKPIVPDNIRRKLEYGNVFRDLASSILQLQPMVYTYWS